MQQKEVANMTTFISSAVPADIAERLYDAAHPAMTAAEEREAEERFIEHCEEQLQKNLEKVFSEAVAEGTDKVFWMLLTQNWGDDATVGKLLKKMALEYAKRCYRNDPVYKPDLSDNYDE